MREHGIAVAPATRDPDGPAEDTRRSGDLSPIA